MMEKRTVGERGRKRRKEKKARENIVSAESSHCATIH